MRGEGCYLALPSRLGGTHGRQVSQLGRKRGKTGHLLADQIRNPKKIPKPDQADSKTRTLSIRHLLFSNNLNSHIWLPNYTESEKERDQAQYRRKDGGILTDAVNEVVWLPEELLEEAALTEVLSSRTEEVRIPRHSLFLLRHGLGLLWFQSLSGLGCLKISKRVRLRITS